MSSQSEVIGVTGDVRTRGSRTSKGSCLVLEHPARAALSTWSQPEARPIYPMAISSSMHTHELTNGLGEVGPMPNGGSKGSSYDSSISMMLKVVSGRKEQIRYIGIRGRISTP